MISIKLMSDPLKIDPSVGFFPTAPAFPDMDPPLELDPAAEDDRDPVMPDLPGSGISDDLFVEPALLSDMAGEPGRFVGSAPLVEASAASRTSFMNVFRVEARRASCSSGTVSLFFSRNPSAS